MPFTTPMPTPRPPAPPRPVTIALSTRNWTKTCHPLAPRDLRTPTPRIRSVNDASMMFATTMPPPPSRDDAAGQEGEVVPLPLLVHLLDAVLPIVHLKVVGPVPVVEQALER